MFLNYFTLQLFDIVQAKEAQRLKDENFGTSAWGKVRVYNIPNSENNL